MQFEKVLTAFCDFFESESVRYALIGGLAVHAWGRVRPTRDIDFAVDSSRSDQVISFAESRGFKTVFRSEAFSNHEHADPEWGHVDFMYLAGATADAVFKHASEKELMPGRLMQVASAEHLAMMKALAMKNFPHRGLYEGEDVRALLQVPGIDRNAIRDYFERHGLLELFDAIEKSR